MKRLTALLLVLLCTSCTALPKEERAFAVALCVEKAEDWRVHARIPTYESGGGYRTVMGVGDSLTEALIALESAAPMHLHLSQLRLLVLDAALADSDALADALDVLSARSDMRLQCAVVMTDESGSRIADALKPSAGARLSKAIDVLLETHAEQGSFLPVTLADMCCMGQRQTPVLMRAVLAQEGIAFCGGYALTADWHAGVTLDEDEVRLLALLMAQSREMRLALDGTDLRVREVRVSKAVNAALNEATVAVNLRLISHSADEAVLLQSLADACAQLLTRLSAAGCDALGLGRKAILCAADMDAWNALDWPESLRHLTWCVTVSAQQPV